MSFCMYNANSGTRSAISRVVDQTFPTDNFTIIWSSFMRIDRGASAFQTGLALGPTNFNGLQDYFDAGVYSTHEWEIAVEGGDTTGGDTPVAQRWYRQAFVKSGLNLTYYYDLDGGSGKVITHTITGGDLAWANGHVLMFGNTPWNSVFEGVDGKIRHAMAFARVMTFNQIDAQSQQGASSLIDSSNIWGQWPLISDGNDISGNARHLNVTEGVTAFDGDPEPATDLDYPTVVGVRNTDVTTDAGGITILLPNGSNITGRMVVIFVTKDGTGAQTWPGGWTQLDEGNDGANASRTGCYYRVIDGTEGFDGTDDSIALTGASEEWHATAVLLSGQHASSAPELLAATGSSTTPNPPNHNPTNWDTEATLWLAYFGRDNSATPTVASVQSIENYSHGNTGGATGVSYGFGIARAGTSASLDPGAWTITTAGWRAYTVAIRPAAAAGGAGHPSGRRFPRSTPGLSPWSVRRMSGRTFKPSGPISRRKAA